MRFTFLAALVGVLAGLAAGGRFTSLRRTEIEAWPFAVGWAALWWAGTTMTLNDSVAFGALLASFVVLLLFALLNVVRIPGMWLIAIGISLNGLVALVNHGTPYRVEALHSAGIGVTDPGRVYAAGSFSHPESADDALTFLGDIVPVAPLREVLSFGDLLLAFGAGTVLFHGITRPVRERSRYRPRHARALVPVLSSRPRAPGSPARDTTATDALAATLDIIGAEATLILPDAEPPPPTRTGDPATAAAASAPTSDAPATSTPAPAAPGDEFWAARAHLLGAISEGNSDGTDSLTGTALRLLQEANDSAAKR